MIYVSTGGFKNLDPIIVIKKLNKNNVFNIELSGGKYTKNIYKKLSKLKKKNNFLIHNYFPPPKKSFVINLASLDEKISEKSFLQIKRSIELTSKLKLKYFTFHAGFLTDPKTKDLGKKFSTLKLYNKKLCESKFFNNLKKLSLFANKKNVKLLIENNVVTKINLNKYKKNPLLMCSPKEISKYEKKISKINMGILLDIGHLKVSCKTLGLDFYKSLKILSPIIEAYHLSNNDGNKDSNNSISEKSKIWKYLRKNPNYATLEIYRKDINKIKSQIKIVRKKVFTNEH